MLFLFLILSLLLVLLTFIALGITIAGFYKKNKKLWQIGLVASFILGLITAFTLVNYVKKSVAYVNSDEFQQEVKANSKTIGKTVGNTVVGASEGVKESMKKDTLPTIHK